MWIRVERGGSAVVDIIKYYNNIIKCANMDKRGALSATIGLFRNCLKYHVKIF